jgi:tRNA(Ile)-lysidine synthase
MSVLPEISAATAGANDLLYEDSFVLAMVSGGADSVALLRLLASGGLGGRALAVLHVDHMLRGGESDSDARFVAELCERLGVPCRVARYDVGAYASAEALNLEDAGRRVRYRFADEELDARCGEAGLPRARGRIATAHTLTDRIETLLMRIAQGAGAGGLVSPRYRRGRLVRPLLDCSRADVVAYLEELGQPWREDSTNADTSRLRARVRAELVPLLRDINPRVDEALARTVRLLADEDELLDEMAVAFARDFATVAGGEVRFDRTRMNTLSRPMMRRVVRAALFATFPEASRLEFEHVEAVCDAMADEAFARDLGHRLRAFTEYGRLIISREPGTAPSLAPSLLDIPGSVDLPGAGSMSAEPAGADEVGDDPLTALVDADRIRGVLTVDSMRPGDRMRPLGMTGSRKLQDVLTDAKIPRRRRPLVPVVRDGERVVWLAGVRMSDEYRVGPHTDRAVLLRWTGPDVERDEA